MDKVWSHVFSATINLTDNTDTWYRKVREIIDKQQSNALWMSESKVSIVSHVYVGGLVIYMDQYKIDCSSRQ